MKKILSIVTLVMICLGAFAQGNTKDNADLNVSLNKDFALVKDGSKATYLTISETEANGAQYSVVQFTINVPEGVKIATKKEGRKDVADVTLNKERFDGLKHTVSINQPNATTIKVAIADASSNDNFYNDNADGEIVPELVTIGLTYTSDDAVEGNTLPITLSGIKFIKQNADADVPVGEISTEAIIATPVKGVKADKGVAETIKIVQDGKVVVVKADGAKIGADAIMK